MKNFAFIPISAFLLAFGWISAAVSSAHGASVALNYDFSRRLSGWSATPDATLVRESGFYRMRSSGWDAKIYRSVTLPAGRFRVQGEGMGLIAVRIVDPNWKDYYVDLNLSGNAWRSDDREFEFPGGKCWLVVQVRSDNGEGMIRWLRLETAPDVGTGEETPSREEIQAHAAELKPVRGFMTGYFHDTPGVVNHKRGETFADMRSWGANVARVNVWPVGHWSTLASHPDFWEHAMPRVLDEVKKRVIAAQNAGIKVVLDCHFPPPVDGKLRDHGTADFWAHPATAEALSRFWTLIAEHMQPYKSAIYGYDLFNEPLDWGQMPYPPKQWRKIAIEVIRAIREVDQTTWIIYETGPGGGVGGFDRMVPLPDARVIYSPHFYHPAEFVFQGVGTTEGTDQSTVYDELGIRYPSVIDGVLWNRAQLESVLLPVIKFQEEWGVPIYVGEFSVVRYAPEADAAQFLQDCIDIFESHGWSWTYHAFRESLFWSLEHDNTYMVDSNNPPQPVTYETERAKVIKRGFSKNTFEEVEGVPAAPEGLTAVAGDGKVVLTWLAVPGATSYNVKVRFQDSGPYAWLARVEGDTQWVDDNLLNGEKHYYVVSALNVWGEGPDSEEASATPKKPPQPTGAVSRISHGSGGTYDVALSVAPGVGGPGGPFGVECRRTSSMEVVVSFDKPVKAGEAMVSDGNATLSRSPVFQGNQMKLSLADVGNGQTVRLSLMNIQGNDDSKLDAAVVAFRVLLGDVNGDGTVSNSDVNLTRAAVGATLARENFRSDVKPDGDISTSDVNTVRAGVGNTVP